MKRFAAWAAVVAVVSLVVIGFVFAGSAGTLATDTSIAGVDVGGMTPAHARRLLERRAASLQNVPVTFTAEGKTYSIRPRELGVHVDWRGAVADAQRNGSGFGPIRGYRRLGLQLFPTDVAPPVESYDAAVSYELRVLAGKIDHAHREAALVRRGLHVSIHPGTTGLVLDREATRPVLVQALAGFDRAPVPLPVRRDPPAVTVARLIPLQRLAARVVSAPVTLQLGATRWRVPRWRLATLLQLPQGGETRLQIAGPAADTYFSKLHRSVDHDPQDASWRPVPGGSVQLVAAQPGVILNAERSAAALLAAAERPSNRVAQLVVDDAPPKLTTAAAAKMSITGTVGSYETIYGGDPNRIHNVQLVAHLIDDKLIAPGETFSFNKTTGDRSAAKGFLEAPVIINGEVQTGLGGGVCQVSTTVFNAAFVAGLPITARTNHALYISHYPLGRDATVDYPDVDLKFVNDTGHWLLLRTWVSSDSLTVALYGTPQHRRVDSVTQPLRVVSPPPVVKTDDPTLEVGQTIVTDPGLPAEATSVERKVYSASGELLSDQTWASSYRAVPKQITVGTKKRPVKPKQKPKQTAAPLSPDGTAPTAPR